MNTINYNLKWGLILPLLLVILNCRKNSDEKSYTISTLENKVNQKIVDSIRIEIDADNDLNIYMINQIKKVNFFEPIKNKLINEDIYAQMIYDQNNIIINLEFGDNANFYEDIYLSKSEPVKIEKIVRTTIIKMNKSVEKLECQEIVNEPLSEISRYRSIDEDKKLCNQTRID